MSRTRVETVIIGGGQAGLTAGYHLAKRGRPFVILDANERIGDAWRNRWDSLRLFTPAHFSRLPGKRLDMPNWSFADEGRDGRLPRVVRRAVRAAGARPASRSTRLEKADGRFVISAGEELYEAENVIVATGAHNIPKTPAFAAELDPRIVQLHSSAYRNPSQLQEGDVLLVGAGNSGAELAVELCRIASRAARRPEARRDPGQARHAAVSAPASASSGSSGTECSRAATRSAGRSARSCSRKPTR